jgi:hypothetical protein
MKVLYLALPKFSAIRLECAVSQDTSAFNLLRIKTAAATRAPKIAKVAMHALASDKAAGQRSHSWDAAGCDNGRRRGEAAPLQRVFGYDFGQR